MGLGAAERLYVDDAVRETPRSDARRKLTFYFMPSSYILARVTRMAEVAKVLRRWGHEVVFCGQDPDHPRSRMSVALAEGFRHIPMKEYYFPYFWDRFQKHGKWVTVWDVIRHQQTHCKIDELMDAQIQLIQRDQPDMVVGDGSMGLSISAHIANVPAGLMFNAYNIKLIQPSSPFMPLLRTFDFFQLAPVRRRVFKKYGVKPKSGMKLILDTPMISPDLPEFVSEIGQFQRNVEFVGPISYSAAATLPRWYDDMKDGTTNIYITMGSTGMLDAFLRNHYEALGKTPYRFVVTTAGQVTDETMAMAPDNFRFAEFAAGDKILKHSSALIYHGGSGSMYQGLEAGAPMLAFPYHLEQLNACNMVEREGFGLCMSPKKTTSNELVAALDRILTEPSFRENAQRLSEPVRNSKGAERTAEILEQRAYSGRVAGF